MYYKRMAGAIKKKWKLILVVWVDIVHGYYDGWCRVKKKSAKLKVSTIKTVGWLVKNKKKSLTVCQNLASDGDGFSLVVIPRGCVKKIRRLKWKN